MTLGLLSAIPEEQRGLSELLSDRLVGTVADRRFTTGRLGQQAVVLARSRIGKVAAATTATVMLERFGVTRLLYLGATTAVSDHIAVGDWVVGSEYLHWDLNAEPLFVRYEVPGYGRSVFGADPAWHGQVLKAAHRAAQGVVGSPKLRGLYQRPPVVHSGLMVSSDQYVSSENLRLQVFKDHPSALCADMESASVAQACADYGVPFVAFRAVFDRDGQTNTGDVGNFVASRVAPACVAVVRELLPLS